MKKALKYLYNNTTIGHYLISKYFKLNNFYLHYILPEEKYLVDKFEQKHGRKIDLNDPKTLNEKIIWLKLYDRTPLHTICADKYAVRAYIEEQVGEEFLVPLLYRTKNVQDIIPKNLPDIPLIIKANHDSSGGVFVYDKSKIDWEQTRKNLKKRLNKSYYAQSKEWQYKNIDPCIIAEKLLIDKNGNIPSDYKVHCFNGKPNMISVDVNRDTHKHYRNWYNTKWEREPYSWSSLKDGKATEPSDIDVAKPKTLDKMLLLSEKLSRAFCYVRVDWYDVDGKLYFGELTFHHDGGNRPIVPEKYDKILGQKITLPKKSVQ